MIAATIVDHIGGALLAAGSGLWLVRSHLRSRREG